MKEILSELLKESRTRIKNPMISSFLLSWVVFNWRGISYFLFSNKEIEFKIAFIAVHYSKSANYIALPLITAFFFTLGLPHLWALIEHFLKGVVSKRAEINNIHREQEARHQKVISDVKSGKKEIDKLNQVKEELTDQVTELTIQNQKLSSSSKILNNEKLDLSGKLEELKTKNQELDLDSINKADRIFDLEKQAKKDLDHLIKIQTELKSSDEAGSDLIKTNERLKDDLGESRISYAENMKTIFELKNYVVNNLKTPLNHNTFSNTTIKRILDSVGLKGNVVLEDLFSILIGKSDDVKGVAKKSYKAEKLIDVDDIYILTYHGETVLKTLYENSKKFRKTAYAVKN